MCPKSQITSLVACQHLINIDPTLRLLHRLVSETPKIEKDSDTHERQWTGVITLIEIEIVC